MGCYVEAKPLEWLPVLAWAWAWAWASLSVAVMRG